MNPQEKGQRVSLEEQHQNNVSQFSSAASGFDHSRKSSLQDRGAARLEQSMGPVEATKKVENPFQFKYKYEKDYLSRFKWRHFGPANHRMPVDGDAMDVDVPNTLFSSNNGNGGSGGKKASNNRKSTHKNWNESYYMDVHVKHLHSQAKSISDSAPIVPIRQLESSDPVKIYSQDDINSNLLESSGLFDKYSALEMMTIHLVTLYQTSDRTFVYDSMKNPKRVLTKPNKGLHNHGHDNENHDYILYVHDTFGNEEGRQFLILDLLGHGTFGQVAKCINLKTKEIVAIKIIKNQSAYFNQSMMEVTILELLNQKYDARDLCHITRMKDTFIHKKHLCIVFELLSLNLFELIKQNHFKGFQHGLIRIFLSQILDALKLLNEAKIIHCDLKPENILLKQMDSPDIKVIDFGSACHEQHTVYTYIQSRFYRSPEILLGLPYNASIDSWSLGCIAAELFLGLPLFPGHSNYDQVYKMVTCLGLPPNHMMEKGKTSGIYFEKLPSETPILASSGSPSNNILRPKKTTFKLRARPKNEKPSKKYFSCNLLQDIILNYRPGVHLTSNAKEQSDYPELSEEEKRNRESLLDLLRGLLKYNPLERWTPQQARKHPYITGEPWTGSFQPPGSTVPPQQQQGGSKRDKSNESKGNLSEENITGNNNGFQRPRAFTINSQLFNIPPQIQRLANAGPSHPAILPIHETDAKATSSGLFNSNILYNGGSTATSTLYPSYSGPLYYPTGHFMTMPPPPYVFPQQQGIPQPGMTSGQQHPPTWYMAAPPGGPSQNIADYRRDYLFSASGEPPAYMFGAYSHSGSFSGSSSFGGSINGSHSGSFSGSHSGLFGGPLGSSRNGTNTINSQRGSTASLNLSSPPSSSSNMMSRQMSQPNVESYANISGSGSVPRKSISTVNRRLSQQTLPILFDEEHPLHQSINLWDPPQYHYLIDQGTQYNPSLYGHMNQPPQLGQGNQIYPGTYSAYPSSISSATMPPMANYYISGGGLSSLTHSVQQRRISNPPTIPSAYFFNESSSEASNENPITKELGGSKLESSSGNGECDAKNSMNFKSKK